MKIEIHPLTDNPTAAWRELSQQQKVIKINVKLPTTEAPSNKVKFSDSILFLIVIKHLFKSNLNISI